MLIRNSHTTLSSTLKTRSANECYILFISLFLFEWHEVSLQLGVARSLFL